MNCLRFGYEPDDIWSGKLRVACEANGFVAKGEAWFTPQDLLGFGKATEAFPLSSETPPQLCGGFGDPKGNLKDVHVGIVIQPHNARGLIRVTVQLATAVYSTPDEDLASNALIRFLVTYGDLASFGADMAALLDGSETEIKLRSSA